MENPLRRSTDLTSPKDAESIFFPKLLSTIREYSGSLFMGDLTAGVIVGIVALPLAIAFGIASGVAPSQGLITAIVAGFLISTLGGSRVQIGGPTGAFVVIVYGIVQKYGVPGLTICTLIAGVMLILMGVFRMGSVIKFIPYPLTVGFTAGIAVIIFSSQIKDFFGFRTGPLPADFVEKWKLYLDRITTLDPTTLIVAFCSFAILIVWPKINRKIPASIVAIVLITAVVKLFRIPVETIGSRFGSLPSALPSFLWPSFSYVEARNLVGPAFTVALLGAIESLLSATVADGMIEGRHRSNTELIGQGIANIGSALFGGIPATGAIARTATNVKNGGRTPIAGIIHSCTLLLIVMLFGNWASLIPMCVLASILIVVSYYMSEFHAFKNLLRAPRMDVAVLLITFFLTVLVDLTVAVEIGMLLSLILFMKRMTDVSSIRQVISPEAVPLDEKALRDRDDSILRRQIPAGVDVYEAEGALFFGVASLIRDNLQIGKSPPKALIFRMRYVFALDATGIRALDELRKSCIRAGTQLIVEGLAHQPRYALERAGMLNELGIENIAETLDEALRRVEQILIEPAPVSA